MYPRLLDSSRKHLNALPKIPPHLMQDSLALKSSSHEEERKTEIQEPKVEHEDGIIVELAQPAATKNAGPSAKDKNRGSFEDVVAGRKSSLIKDQSNVVLKDLDARAKLQNDKLEIEMLEEHLQHNRADSSYLSKKAAVDMQNSLLRHRGRSREVEPSLNINQMSNEAVGPDEGKKVRDFLGLGGVRGSRKFVGDANNNQMSNEAVGPDKDKMVGFGGVMGSRKFVRDAKRAGGLKSEHLGSQMSERNPPAINLKKVGEMQPRISVLGYFGVESYLSAQRMKEGGGDKMKRFQFNQVASDATLPDRPLRDFRNPL